MKTFLYSLHEFCRSLPYLRVQLARNWTRPIATVGKHYDIAIVNLPDLPFRSVRSWIRPMRAIRKQDNPKIENILPFTQEGKAVERIVKDALDLIKHTDPVRFRRVLRRVKYVVNQRFSGTGGVYYSRSARECNIDLTGFNISFEGDGYEWFVAEVAKALVFCATAGTLHGRHRIKTAKNQERYEEITNRQQWEFAQKLGKGKYDYANQLMPDYRLKKKR